MRPDRLDLEIGRGTLLRPNYRPGFEPPDPPASPAKAPLSYPYHLPAIPTNLPPPFGPLLMVRELARFHHALLLVEAGRLSSCTYCGRRPFPPVGGTCRGCGAPGLTSLEHFMLLLPHRLFLMV